MRTVCFEDVLRGAGRLCGFPRERIGLEEFRMFREGISRRAELGWQEGEWPELCFWEERTFDDTAARLVLYEQADETPMGTVLDVRDKSPDLNRDSAGLDFVLRATGFVVVDRRVQDTTTSVWVKFRTRAPVLFGETYSAAASYAAGAQIYYRNGDGTYRGDFWNCVSAADEGESPEAQADKWEKVELPAFLARYLERGAAADYLRSDERDDQADREESEAQVCLARAVLELRGQSGQRRQLEVSTR